MFLDFAGTLVNLDHVAQVQPYTPGAGVRLTVILSNGNAVHVKDGEEAVRIYGVLTRLRREAYSLEAFERPVPLDFTPAPGEVVVTYQPTPPKPPKKGKK